MDRFKATSSSEIVALLGQAVSLGAQPAMKLADRGSCCRHQHHQHQRRPVTDRHRDWGANPTAWPFLPDLAVMNGGGFYTVL